MLYKIYSPPKMIIFSSLGTKITFSTILSVKIVRSEIKPPMIVVITITLFFIRSLPSGKTYEKNKKLQTIKIGAKYKIRHQKIEPLTVAEARYKTIPTPQRETLKAIKL